MEGLRHLKAWSALGAGITAGLVCDGFAVRHGCQSGDVILVLALTLIGCLALIAGSLLLLKGPRIGRSVGVAAVLGMSALLLITAYNLLGPGSEVSAQKLSAKLRGP